jgi:hypothetical protein
VTASHKKWLDSVIWLVSVPTAPNFDRPYSSFTLTGYLKTPETGLEHKDPYLRPYTLYNDIEISIFNKKLNSLINLSVASSSDHWVDRHEAYLRLIKYEKLKPKPSDRLLPTIVNPTFDSQTKDNLTTPSTKFGSKLDLDVKFMEKLYKSGILS